MTGILNRFRVERRRDIEPIVFQANQADIPSSPTSHVNGPRLIKRGAVFNDDRRPDSGVLSYVLSYVRRLPPNNGRLVWNLGFGAWDLFRIWSFGFRILAAAHATQPIGHQNQ